MSVRTVFSYLAGSAIGITNGTMADGDRRLCENAAKSFANSLVRLSGLSEVRLGAIPVLASDSLSVVVDPLSDAVHFLFAHYNGAPVVVLMENDIAGATRDMFESLVRTEAGKLLFSFSLPLSELRHASEEKRVQLVDQVATRYMDSLSAGLAKLKILFLAANPRETPPLDLEEERRSIKLELAASRFRDKVKLVEAEAVRPGDLVRHLREERPEVVHFSGHGKEQGIILRNDGGGFTVARGDSLARVFSQRGVKLVVLNSCYSIEQAKPLSQSVDAVIGTTKPVIDLAARQFSAAFFRTLCDGHTIEQAFRDGRDLVDLSNSEDVFWLHGNVGQCLVD